VTESENVESFVVMMK